MDTNQPITIGISACLLGHKVRYNGEAQPRNAFLEELADGTLGGFKLETACPEVGIGLGVPRDTIRLTDCGGEDRALGGPQHSIDHTEALRQYARQVLAAHPHWRGYIGVKNSPSCGHSQVRRWTPSGASLPSTATGIFIQELRRLNPLLPIEEDARLQTPTLRRAFLNQVLAYAHHPQPAPAPAKAVERRNRQ